MKILIQSNKMQEIASKVSAASFIKYGVLFSLTITRVNKRRMALLPMSIAAKRKPDFIKNYSKPKKVIYDLKNFVG